MLTISHEIPHVCNVRAHTLRKEESSRHNYVTVKLYISGNAVRAR